ncbi:uncharacterized protein LY79DRAFT_111467 [Colletotrichum navitas]|uniref:Uncharacterized protein n=1 Tax=Colletotrichum navitas TaxID=681940 RepID=A0AAD8V853_9PEZI|nr:uncharacterized protein LY79DRAFT_111467 [Colletotrichum navitas]KAK1595356.1 hypothetical protein LY79DRAFT_111467 [Colletotrichum navitas]
MRHSQDAPPLTASGTASSTPRFARSPVAACSRASIRTSLGYRLLATLTNPWEPALFHYLRRRGVGYLRADDGTAIARRKTYSPGRPTRAGEHKRGSRSGVSTRSMKNLSEAMEYDDAVARGTLDWSEHPSADRLWTLLMLLSY